MQARERRADRERRDNKAERKKVASIYDLKLPIPGPPGREPVSRSTVAIVEAPADDLGAASPGDSHPKPVTAPGPAPVDLERRQPDRPRAAVRGSAKPIQTDDPSARSRAAPGDRRAGPPDGEHAPFSRPFVGAASSSYDAEDSADEAGAPQADEPFPRPFAMKSRADDSARDGAQATDEDR